MFDILEEDEPVLALSMMPSSINEGSSKANPTLKALKLIGIDHLFGLPLIFCCLEKSPFDNLIVVESRWEALAFTLSLADLSEYFSRFKNADLGFNLCFNESLDSIKVQISQYYFKKELPCLYGQKVVKARYLSTELNQYSTWIHAPEGLAQSILVLSKMKLMN